MYLLDTAGMPGLIIRFLQLKLINIKIILIQLYQDDDNLFNNFKKSDSIGS